MGVVALPNIQPQGAGGPETDWELRSLTARFPGTLGASLKTLERLGAAWVTSLLYKNLSGSNASRMQTFLASARGQAQRFYVPAYSYTLRGSFPTSELLTNGFFTSTSGWTVASDLTLTASDGLGRLTRTTTAPGSESAIYASSPVTTVANAPYAMRYLLLQGRGSFSNGHSPTLNTLTAFGTASTSYGLTTAAVVRSETSLSPGIALFDSASGMAGEFFSIGYASFARCALVDNGCNLLTRSEEIDHANWTKTATTVTANAESAPNGTVTADWMVETTATSGHNAGQNVTVSSSQTSLFFGAAMRPGFGRDWVELLLIENTGSTAARAYFNITTGALGTTSVGANWSNIRSVITSLGGGWYYCGLVATKTNAATSVTAYVAIANADNSDSYTGNASNRIAVWRPTVSVSSVFARLVQTTSSVLSSGTSQTGGALYLKGLPASTNGLLLTGDYADISTSVGTQFVRTLTSLNSDAAGLGYWQFEAPLRNSPSDNGAVVIQRPLCRMGLDSNSIHWTEHDGGFSSLDFTAVEDVAA